MHIRDYLAALEFANAVRAAEGLEPLERLPAGVPGNPADCAIARAIPDAVVGSSALTFDGGARSTARRAERRLPAEVADFVAAFDAEGSHGTDDVCDPGSLVDGGIDDDKGTLVPA